MQLGLSALLTFIDACPTETLVLATVIRTQGASYRKAGAMMLIDGNMQTSGLVSGGCLEDDLKSHAEDVFARGIPQVVVYDLSQEEAASMWGLGLGCGGRIEVLLEPVSANNNFGGLNELRSAFQAGHPCTLYKVIEAANESLIGNYRVEVHCAETESSEFEASMRSAPTQVGRNITTLAIPVSPLKRLLVCGAGPDAIPLVKLAATLGWQVVITDPRPAYLNADYFPLATKLLCDSVANVDVGLHGPFQAAVIMTHHVERDCAWLIKLYAHPIVYIGLLGPAARRDKLLEKAGLTLEPRLHGPAGLDIGAALPEEIALAIVAQMHATLEQRSGGPLCGGNVGTAHGD